MRLVISVGADTDEAKRGLDDLNRHAQTFGESIKQGLGLGAGLAIFQTALAGIGAAFSAAKGSVIDFNQQIDSARASMGKFFDSAESLNNSLANLQALANSTPFTFPQLLIAQQRTIGAATSAQQLKENMDAITVAAANSGRISAANMDRISLALGQITTKTKVQGDELLQLNEAGVNATQMLADYFHKTTGEITQMVQKGEITSQDMWAAFRAYAADPKNREALDNLAVTFEGAMSTITDVMQSTIASTFRPFFDLLTEGANAIAKFLQSEQFKVWAEAIRIGVEGAANGLRTLFSALAPIGNAIQQAFGQFTSGDFAGAFATIGTALETALGNAWTTVTGFIGQMFGAGANLATSFADGILQGGVAAVQGAIDAIAGLIASFLIGGSPPPAGPLARIDEGGRNTAAAWVDAFRSTMTNGVGGAVTTAAATIRGLQAAGRDAGDAIRELENASKDLDRAMAGVRERINDIKAAVKEQTDALKDQIQTARDHYADAIATVRDQIDTIKTAHEKAAQAVQDQIDRIKDTYDKTIDGIKARIDEIKTRYDAQEAAIQAHIDAVREHYTVAIETVKVKIDDIKTKFSEQTAAIQAQAEAIKTKYGAAIDDVKTRIEAIKTAQQAQVAPLETQVRLIQDAGKYVKEQLAAEQSITNARTEQMMLQALGDPALRGQLQGQLAVLNQQQQQLSLQQQLNEAQGKLSGGGLSPLEAESLRLKVQQLGVQQQLANLVNSQQLGEATRQGVVNEATQKQVALQQQIAEAHGKLLALPIEQKIAAINAQATAALVPLEAHLKSVEAAQKAALDPIEARLKAIKAEEATALKPLEATLKSLEHEQKAALEPLQASLKAVKAEEAAALKPLEAQLKAVEAAKKAALDPLEETLKGIKREATDAIRPLEEQVNSLQKASDATIKPMEAQIRALESAAKETIKPLEAQVEALQHQKTAIGEQLQTWRDIKAEIALQIADIKAGEAAAKEMGKAVGAIGPVKPLHVDLSTAQKEAEEKVKTWGATLAQKLSDGFHDWIDAHFGTAVASAIGAALGGMLFGPVGAVAGALIGGAIWDGVNKKLAEAGFDTSPVLTKIGEGIKTGDWTKVTEGLSEGFNGLWNALFAPATATSQGGLATRLLAWLQAQFNAIDWTSLSRTIGDLLAKIDWKAMLDRISGVGDTIAAWLAEEIKKTDFGPVSQAIGYSLTTSLVKMINLPGQIIGAMFQGLIDGDTTALGHVLTGVGGGLIKGIVKAVTDDPLDAALAIFTVLLTPARVVTAIGSAFKGIPIAGSIITWITDGIASAGTLMRNVTGLTSLWEGTLQPLIESFGTGLVNGIKGLPGKVGLLIWDAIAGLFKAPAGGAATSVIEGEWTVVGNNAAESAAKAIEGNASKALMPRIPNIAEGFSSAAKPVIEGVYRVIGSNSAEGFVAGLEGKVGILERVGTWAFNILTTLRRIFRSRSPSDETFDIGVDVADGFIDGVESKNPTVLDRITTFANDVIKTFKSIFGITSPSTVFAGFGGDMLQGLLDGLNAKVQTVLDRVTAISTDVINAVKRAFGIASPSSIFNQIGQDMLQGMLDGLNAFWTGTLNGWWENFKNLVFTALGWAGTALTWVGSLVQIGTAVLAGIWNGIEDFWTKNLSPWLSGFGRSVVGAITGVATWAGQGITWLVDVGRAVLQGFWDGLNAVWGDENNPNTVKGLLKVITDWIPGFIKDALGIHSPSQVMHDLGANMMHGLIHGLESRFPDLQTTMSRAFGAVKDWGKVANQSVYGNDLLAAIQGLGGSLGGDEFGRVAAAVAKSEGADGDLSREGSGGARGPFQFDPGGELQNFAAAMHLSLEEAGNLAGAKPLLAAQWALQGYLGDAIRAGLSQGLHGATLANYASRYGQRPQGSEINDPNDPGAFWARAGRFFTEMFPGLGLGGVVPAMAGGSLFRLGEAGRDEAVIPLPEGWRPGDRTGGGDINIYIQAPVYGVSHMEDVVINAVRSAQRRGRTVSTLV